MPETPATVEQLRIAAQRRDELARAFARKAEAYREQAKEMREVAERIAHGQSGQGKARDLVPA